MAIIRKIIHQFSWILNQIKSSLFPVFILIIIGAINSLTAVFIALTTKKLFDSAQYGRLEALAQSGMIIIGIVLIQTILQSIYTIYSARITTGLSNNLRSKLLDKLMKSQWLDFTKYHSGDLLTHMTSDVDAVTSGVTSVIPNMISLIISLFASIIVLFIFDPMLALFAFLLGPATVIFTRLFGRKLKEYYLRIQETESGFRGFVQECLKNIHIIKTFRLEQDSFKSIYAFQNSRMKWVVKRSRISAISSSVLSLCFWAGFLLALFWGSVRLSKGTATFGTITVFLQLVSQVQGPFTSLAYSIPQLIVMHASSGRLMKLYEMKDENYTEERLSWKAAGIVSANLGFCYNSESAVLNGINFHIRPGEFTAIVGASGEGKTTLVRLLLSLLKPSEGQLAFYNPDTDEKFDADVITRSLASYVPQGNTLFSGTISENVLLGNKTASEEELINALKMACIWDFVDSLPEKTNTKVGENGYGLSEGQAQRISIARALLSRKPVLILDEATSALDSDTELEVLNAIASIKPIPTCIIITHRKAALEFCSRVLSLENGYVSEIKNSNIE